MISDRDKVAIRRATALAHFVPGFGFRVRRGHEVLVEVGSDLGAAGHKVAGPCEFRWMVTTALDDPNRQWPEPFDVDDRDGLPLRVDWAISPLGRLHQSGLIESMSNGGTRWAFATLVALDTVGNIVAQFGPDPKDGQRVDAYYDENLKITIVVLDQPKGKDIASGLESASDILTETMAQELLCQASAAGGLT